MTRTITKMTAAKSTAGVTAPDQASRHWVEDLRSDGARRDTSIRELHANLLRAARRETNRRRNILGGAAGPELDDLAHQAAADALLQVIEHLDSYRGDSRFTTWAYRFVINQVSLKIRRHQWSGRRVPFDQVDWEHLPDRLSVPPDRRSEHHA